MGWVWESAPSLFRGEVEHICVTSEENLQKHNSFNPTTNAGWSALISHKHPHSCQDSNPGQPDRGSKCKPNSGGLNIAEYYMITRKTAAKSY